MILSNREPVKVLVVGAGLAGLTAARTLAAAGVEVTVYEARDRVGGRTYTVRDGFTGGQHGDLGGELVTADYHALTALCEEAGVALSERVWIEREQTLPGETPLEGYLADGRIIVEGGLLTGARFAAVDDEIRVALRDTSPAPHEVIEQWTRRAGLSALARGALAGIGRMPVQYDPSQIDAHYLVDAHVGAVRRIVGGSQVLADTLARDLDVRLEAPVRAVRQAGGRVEVELENGDRMTAGQVVVAVPPFVLPTVGFDPPLPATHVGALTSLQRAYGGKVIGQYAEGDAVRAALSRGVFADGPLNTAWVSNHYVTEGPAVVSGFICGAQRHVLESDGDAFAALDEVVRIAVGEPVTRIAGRRKNWMEDPFALGMGATLGYTFRRALVAQFATPERRVHFAGDHTDADLPATMEGAVRSGRRAADEVLRQPRRMSLDEIDTELVRA
ncbi:FAD-dependent oxidoreductase [Actinomadura sp. KC216]|uniref:flavin monoamine oxidase family protein n=1 Tax=Actinomadura sp. KC216 TaxID=2530370 RepID=UPI00104A1CEC|nr:NAD(P)/FAD-dependent oxidoreductase [Actinomadura sp. KC216]TDB88730.1 FAD-dependent oxidoreductase [Actinomadura sp. KC216]